MIGHQRHEWICLDGTSVEYWVLRKRLQLMITPFGHVVTSPASSEEREEFAREIRAHREEEDSMGFHYE